jgi:hypothetical protein
VVENAEEWELGLLTIGLHQFETEQIPLGGGRSRGLGVVKLEIDQMNWINVNNDPEKLISYLRKLVNNNPDLYEDGKQLRSKWTEALIHHLREALSQPSNLSTSSGGQYGVQQL